MPTVIANPVPGLYGHSGWLDDTGIRALLRPLTASGSECSDYARVQGIGAPVAERLLALLPAEQLEDRQNNAPALGDLLSAAVTHPGVRLCGYMIAPPRWDERLTIDAVLVPASDLGPSSDLGPASGPSGADGRSDPAARDAVGSAEGVGALEGIGAQGTGSPTEGVGAPDGAGAPDGVGAPDGAGAPGAISAPNGSDALATASAGGVQSGIPDGARATGALPREEHWRRIRGFLGLAADTVAPDELSCAYAGPGGALVWWAWWD